AAAVRLQRETQSGEVTLPDVGRMSRRELRRLEATLADEEAANERSEQPDNQDVRHQLRAEQERLEQQLRQQQLLHEQLQQQLTQEQDLQRQLQEQLELQETLEEAERHRAPEPSDRGGGVSSPAA
ncbi:unnamed protein product, partial [Polarella glacialis]